MLDSTSANVIDIKQFQFQSKIDPNDWRHSTDIYRLPNGLFQTDPRTSSAAAISCICRLFFLEWFGRILSLGCEFSNYLPFNNFKFFQTCFGCDPNSKQVLWNVVLAYNIQMLFCDICVLVSFYNLKKNYIFLTHIFSYETDLTIYLLEVWETDSLSILLVAVCNLFCYFSLIKRRETENKLCRVLYDIVSFENASDQSL